MTSPLAAAIVFLTTLLSAWCWPLYFRYCQERKALKAALCDCALIGLGMIAIVGYTDDHRLALPILAAGFLGTFLVVRKR